MIPALNSSGSVRFKIKFTFEETLYISIWNLLPVIDPLQNACIFLLNLASKVTVIDVVSDKFLEVNWVSDTSLQVSVWNKF